MQLKIEIELKVRFEVQKRLIFEFELDLRMAFILQQNKNQYWQRHYQQRRQCYWKCVFYSFYVPYRLLCNWIVLKQWSLAMKHTLLKNISFRWYQSGVYAVHSLALFFIAFWTVLYYWYHFVMLFTVIRSNAHSVRSLLQWNIYLAERETEKRDVQSESERKREHIEKFADFTGKKNIFDKLKY